MTRQYDVLVSMPAGGWGVEIIAEQAGEALGINILVAALKGSGYTAKAMSNATEDEVLSGVAQYAPKIIGLSVTWANLASCLRLAAKAKKNNPNTHIILGGPGVTFEYETILQNAPAIDVIVLGEGHDTIVELAEAACAPDQLARIRGIAYRQGDRVVLTHSRPGVSMLSDMPLPDRTEFQDVMTKRGIHTARLLSAWGCHRRCTFCLNRPWIRFCRPQDAPDRLGRSPASVVKELRELQKCGARTVIFVDEDAIGSTPEDIARIQSFVSLLKRARLTNLNLSILTTVVGVRDHSDLIRSLVDVGLTRIFLGVENLSGGGLAQLGARDKTPLDDLASVYEFLQKLNIFCMMGFILFNPFTKAEDVEINLRFLEKNPMVIAPFSNVFFRKAEIYKGTDLYKKYSTRFKSESSAYETTDRYRFNDPTIQKAADLLDRAWKESFISDVDLWKVEQTQASTLVPGERADFVILKNNLSRINIEMVRRSMTIASGDQTSEDLLNWYRESRKEILSSFRFPNVHNERTARKEIP